MCFLLICFLLQGFEAGCVPVENFDRTTTEYYTELEERKAGDTPQSSQEKNPVQEWFENLGKNATTTSQNALNTMKEWFSKLSNGVNSQSNNLPVMYMGSFQLVKMPMPQFSDLIKGMGDLATAAQTVNKMVGNGGLQLPTLG